MMLLFAAFFLSIIVLDSPASVLPGYYTGGVVQAGFDPCSANHRKGRQSSNANTVGLNFFPPFFEVDAQLHLCQ